MMAKGQENLFGDADKVYNVLHTEKTIVKEEISAAEKSITRLEKKIGILGKREEEIQEAIKIMEKSRPKKKTPPKKR